MSMPEENCFNYHNGEGGAGKLHFTPSEIGKMSERPFGAILLLIVACIYIQNTFTPLKDCPQNVLQKSHFLPKEGCS